MSEIQDKLESLLYKGWSQAALADELDVTTMAIRYWRTGERSPGSPKMLLLALDALESRKDIPKRRRYQPGSRKRQVTSD